jgi:AcrR family transcriptional regulator
MFTNKEPARRRGRPRGRTADGDATRARLYAVAIAMIADRGYDAATLREVAEEAGVSPALLYRYFPSKRAVVFALYESLSQQFADDGATLPPGRWRDRGLEALTRSLRVLEPHRGTLRSLVPVLVGGEAEGVLANQTALARMRVQSVFERAVTGASDAPAGALAPAMGRLLYLLHLGVILWWLLDRSPGQRATSALVALLRRMLPPFALALRVGAVRGYVIDADRLAREALLPEVPTAAPPPG